MTGFFYSYLFGLVWNGWAKDRFNALWLAVEVGTDFAEGEVTSAGTDILIIDVVAQVAARIVMMDLGV